MAWHTVERIAGDTYRIYEPMGSIPGVGLSSTNMYLLVGNERAVLIDSGMGIGDARAAVAAITSQPCEVLNTHSHWDHTGANALFDETGIHELEAQLLGREHDILPDFLEALRSPAATDLLPASFDLGTYRVSPNPATRIVHDGDMIDLGGRVIQALYMPGHSPGHTAYWDEKGGLLFTGDTAYAGPVFCTYWGGGPETFARTAVRLAALPGPLTVCPGHNDVIEDPQWLNWYARCVGDAVAGRAGCISREKPFAGREFSFETISIWLLD